jgi:hypothetical protein
MPRLAMAPKAVPLMSKCADSARQAPPGQESVMVTVTGRPEQALLPVHLFCVLVVHHRSKCIDIFGQVLYTCFSNSNIITASTTERGMLTW